MADNAQKIVEIEEIQNEGAQSVSVDGVTVVRSFDELRKRKAELVRGDDDAAQRARRPRASTIDMSGSF